MASGGGAANVLRFDHAGDGPQVLARPRLFAQLRDAVRRRLTFVVAPPGYGKTTLLTDFVDQCAGDLGLTTCWYTALPRDGDGTLVLAGILQAIRRRLPGFGEQTLRLLEEGRSAGAGDAERLVASGATLLAAELREGPATDVLVVVDDYHLVDEAPSGRTAVQLLLERLSENVHVVLASRTFPALDTSQLAMRDEVGGLRPADLAFTRDELGGVLTARVGLADDPELLDAVEARTEGWITGLVLATPPAGDPPSARRAALLDTLQDAWHAGDRLHDYLARELLDRHAAPDQDVLLAASLPDVCDPAELDAVLGTVNAGAALARLSRAGVPLTLLHEGSHARYRVHALLQQFLRTHLELTNRRRFVEWEQCWGQQADSRGDPAAAIAHYLAAGLHARAARLVEQIGIRWIEAGRHESVGRWLAALPSALLDKHPRLALCAARLDVAQGRRAQAVERARQAGFAAQRMRDSTTVARAQLLEAFCILATGHGADATQLCLDVLASRTVRRQKPLLADAYRTLSIAERVRGLLEPAVDHMEQALALYEQAGQRWDVAFALGNLGAAYSQLGRSERARWSHQRALALQRELGDLDGSGRSLNNLGLLHFYAAEYADAERLFAEALGIATQTANPRSEAARAINYGDLRRAQLRFPEAFDLYQRAAAAALAADDPYWHAYALASHAAALVAAGDPAQAESVAREALAAAERRGAQEIAADARTTLAAAALARGRRREAAALLEAARRAARDTGSVILRARAYLWTAVAAHQLKRWGEAVECVRTAADAAALLGGPGPLAMDGPTVAPTLAHAAARGVAPELLARALDALDADAAATVRAAAHQDPPPAQLPLVEVRLLGTFRGLAGGAPLEQALPAGSRVRELFVHLVLHPAGRRRDEIAAHLWPEAGPGQEVTLASSTLHRLRQATFPELVESEPTASGSTHLRLNPLVVVNADVHRFESQLRDAQRPGLSTAQRRRLLGSAVRTYEGPLWPESDAQWVIAARQRLEDRYLNALGLLIELDWARADYDACLRWCEQLLRAEPDEHNVYLRLLECYERLGQPLAALVFHRRHVRELAAHDSEAAHLPDPVLHVIARLQRASGSAGSSRPAAPPRRQ